MGYNVTYVCKYNINEIIENLRIEPPMVTRVLNELKSEGMIVSKPVD